MRRLEGNCGRPGAVPDRPVALTYLSDNKFGESGGVGGGERGAMEPQTILSSALFLSHAAPAGGAGEEGWGSGVGHSGNLPPPPARPPRRGRADSARPPFGPLPLVAHAPTAMSLDAERGGRSGRGPCDAAAALHMT